LGGKSIKNKKIVQLNRKGRGFLTGSFSPLPNENRIELHPSRNKDKNTTEGP
jgi:hypothetical protein